jgi:hypothetical protein
MSFMIQVPGAYPIVEHVKGLSNYKYFKFKNRKDIFRKIHNILVLFFSGISASSGFLVSRDQSYKSCTLVTRGKLAYLLHLNPSIHLD